MKHSLRQIYYIFFLPLVIFFASATVSCISDSMTASPSATLSFSTDTVAFDTVFTDLGTPTARLKVFNRNSKGVNISSIRFRNPETIFSMNVDGVSGKEFADVEIRGGDSIFVFIECFINPTESDEPFLVEDKLEFVTNGVTQDVQVEAYGQNVTRLKDLTLTEDLTLTDERPYVIFGSLTVPEDRTLRVLPGAKLLFHDRAQLVVSGRIEAIGEPDRMIDMRGDRIGNVLPGIGYDILAGQWTGIRIAPESFDNRMEYVNMRSTSEGVRVDSCGNLSRTKLTLRNSWLHNSQSTVFDARHSKVDAYGVCFSEAADAVVSLMGGIHNFVQCTIANNYLFAAISQPLLTLGHVKQEDLEDDPENPLLSLQFNNGIIYGLASDLNIGNLDDTDVWLHNVLLKSNGEDDEHFVDCIWGENPLFKTIRSEYLFNYRLLPDSPAIGKGNVAYITDETLIDIDGINRLDNGAPTLGAYAMPPADYSRIENVSPWSGSPF